MQPSIRLLSVTTALLLGSLLSACGKDGAAPTPDGITAATPPPDDARCKPTAGGPYWLLEGEELTFEVKCGTGLALDGHAFAVGPLPDGAVYDANSRKVTFKPRLDQAAVYEVDVQVAQTSEATRVKIGVADAFQDPSNVPVVDPKAYGEEYGLPVLFVSPKPKAEDYAPATVIYRGHSYKAQAKLRGDTSLLYPKNSYALKFEKSDLFQEPDEAGGFVNRHKIALTTTFDDNSYLRQRLAFDLWNRLDPGHIQIKTYSAVVYFDGEYYGLYTVSDHVDGDLYVAQGCAPGGNLYKAVDHDANFMLTSFENNGASKQTLHDGYTKKEGTPPEGEPGAFADLEDLVSLVATSDAATFREEIGKKITLPEYEDWFIFTTFIRAEDSAGKNSYHYHDPGTDLFRYAPWDFNASFGQTWRTERLPAAEEVDYFEMSRLFQRFMEEPTLGAPLRARYHDVLRGSYALEGLLSLLDGYAARIGPSAHRDEAKWGDAFRAYGGWKRDSFTTYDEEIAYVRAWLADRWQFQSGLY
jgi:hypothetical protein